MKIRTETHQVAPSEYTETFYGCDHCSYETEVAANLKQHHAKEHAVKGNLTAGEQSFLRFESKEDFEAYKEGKGGYDYSDPYYGDFEEPGWYHVSYHSGPCGRGCCSREWHQLTPAARFLATEQADINERQSKLDAVKAALETP